MLTFSQRMGLKPVRSATHGGIHPTDVDQAQAVQRPVAFEKIAYIRVGSYTKPLRDVPALEARLWDKLRAVPFESAPAKTNLELATALAMVDFGRYYDLLEKPQPSDFSGVAHDLLEEGILISQDNGLFSVSNLGAVLLAKRLSDFPGLVRKALRIVQYNGNNRVERIREFPDSPAPRYMKYVPYWA